MKVFEQLNMPNLQKVNDNYEEIEAHLLIHSPSYFEELKENISYLDKQLLYYLTAIERGYDTTHAEPHFKQVCKEVELKLREILAFCGETEFDLLESLEKL